MQSLVRMVRPRVRRSADEVAAYLNDFLHGADGLWDWEEFTSRPIAEPRLESIRQRAAAVHFPLNDESARALRELRAEAERLNAAQASLESAI